ncbi:MAG: CDP-alcohol phosphatidyltransferase family protein [Anaerolineae bacterium]|nr:CDP-alcohol phosphatidyltransferase family protein [Anaerolineae bacterium]MDW8100949.1 CDP-alcohol phosphatidyltransferase family protein [Anaerolineae bacterium]
MAAWAWLADLLTLLRVVVATWLVWMGLTQGAAALPQAVLVALVAWLGDALDGPLARRSRHPTLFGRYDFVADVLLTWSALIYITLSGFLPIWLTIVYTILTTVAVIAFQRKAVMVLFMRPVDFTCGIVALTRSPEAGWMLAATLAGLAVIYRRRLRDRALLWLRELGWISLSPLVKETNVNSPCPLPTEVGAEGNPMKGTPA